MNDDLDALRRLPGVVDVYRSKSDILVRYMDGSMSRINTRTAPIASQIITTERRLKVLRALAEGDQ